MGKIELDDILELHSTIITFEERQKKLVALAQEFMKEAEYLGGLINTFKNDYANLKEKAKA